VIKENTYLQVFRKRNQIVSLIRGAAEGQPAVVAEATLVKKPEKLARDLVLDAVQENVKTISVQPSEAEEDQQVVMV
jgi:hypothetical protein